jgi:hypothetical protein
MPFSGGELSEKGFPSGWDADAEDQASQRVFRMTQLLEAMTFRPFSWDRFNSLKLKYAYHGGYIDTGAAWLKIKDSAEVGGTFVTLVDGATNFIERTDAGVVVVNQAGFTYDLHIPMAQIKARNGALVPSTYIDSRPEVGGAPQSGVGGQTTFAQIIGQILDAQVPLTAVAQWQFELALSFTQMIDQIADAQVPESAVTQHEAALSILFSQIVGFIDPGQVPAAAVLQYIEAICLGVLACPPFDMILARSIGLIADDRIAASSVTQWCAEILKCDPFDFILQRATSRRPWSSSDRCHANGALA